MLNSRAHCGLGSTRDKNRPGSGDRRYEQLHGLATAARPGPYYVHDGPRRRVLASCAEKEDLRSDPIRSPQPPFFRLMPRARNARNPAALTGACWQLDSWAGVCRCAPARAVARWQTGRRLQRESRDASRTRAPGGCWNARWVFGASGHPGRVRATCRAGVWARRTGSAHMQCNL